MNSLLKPLMEYFSHERMVELLSLVREYRWYVAGTAVVGVALYRVLNTPRSLPPGPRGWPVVGAVNEINEDLYTDIVRLGRTHGDIFSLYMFGQ